MRRNKSQALMAPIVVSQACVARVELAGGDMAGERTGGLLYIRGTGYPWHGRCAPSCGGGGTSSTGSSQDTRLSSLTGSRLCFDFGGLGSRHGSRSHILVLAPASKLSLKHHGCGLWPIARINQAAPGAACETTIGAMSACDLFLRLAAPSRHLSSSQSRTRSQSDPPGLCRPR